MFRNASQVLGAVSTLVFAGGLIWQAVRRESPTTRIPWWWWLGNGASMLLLGSVHDSRWVQGPLQVAGAFSAGIGATLLVQAWRDGRLRIRGKTRTRSRFDTLAEEDWRKGTELVRVELISWHYDLQAVNPSIDFVFRVVSMNVHPALIAPDVRGRVRVPDQRKTQVELTHPPELVQVTRRSGDSGTTSLVHGDVPMDRAQELDLTLRQHLIPEARDMLQDQAGSSVPFDLRGVDVGVIFQEWDEHGTPRPRNRERLRLGTHRMTIPNPPVHG